MKFILLPIIVNSCNDLLIKSSYSGVQKSPKQKNRLIIKLNDHWINGWY
jgi:hypothetical protein